MIEAMVMESYAYRIYLFGATMLLKLVTGACATGEREPKGPETREKEESNYGAVVGEEIFVCSPDVTDAMCDYAMSSTGVGSRKSSPP